MVEFENVQIDLVENMAFAMGHYLFTVATGEYAGSKVRVEFTFGYKRYEEGIPRIFLHHSSVPYSDAEPAPPVEVEPIMTVHEGAGATDITDEDIALLQTTWGQAITDISAAYLNGEDYITVASEAAGNLMGYTYSNVLFKPTKAAEHPFRPDATGALSYFLGYADVPGGFEEDAGFAHNGAQSSGKTLETAYTAQWQFRWDITFLPRLLERALGRRHEWNSLLATSETPRELHESLCITLQYRMDHIQQI